MQSNLNSFLNNTSRDNEPNQIYFDSENSVDAFERVLGTRQIKFYAGCPSAVTASGTLRDLRDFYETYGTVRVLQDILRDLRDN